MPTIHCATPDDAVEMLEIYRPIVETTAISFEAAPPTVDEFQQRVQSYMQKYPWLVCKYQNKVLGYAYGSQHKAREAYQWSVEPTIYVHPEHHQRGIARALYTALVAILRLQGFYTAYAVIALPNNASIGFHASFGFTNVAIMRNTGYKFGQWRDVAWMELALQDQYPKTIKPPLLPLEIEAGAWAAAVEAGAARLKNDKQKDEQSCSSLI